MIKKKQSRRKIISVLILADMAIIYYRGKDKKITYSYIYTNLNNNIEKIAARMARNKQYLQLRIDKNRLIFISISDMIENLNISPIKFTNCGKIQDEFTGDVLTVYPHDKISRNDIVTNVKSSPIYRKLPIDKKLLFEIKML